MEQRAEPEGPAKVPGNVEGRTFLDYLEEVRPEVNERISGCLSALGADGGMDAELAAMLEHGKRLRAGVCMLSFDAFSDLPERRNIALDLSAAIELAHSASLILDDMLDGDELRRGLPALYISRGQKRALLEVIVLLSLPYTIAARHGEEYVEGLAYTQRKMAGGAMAEMEVRPGPSPSRLYEEVITRKTGEMFGLAARFGAAAAGRSLDLVERMGRFGVSVGRVMQIADDITDLRSSQSGKRGPGNASELLLQRCGGLEETLAKAIAEALSAAERVKKAADGTSAGLPAWMPVLRSSPSDIAGLMLGEGRLDKRPPRRIA